MFETPLFYGYPTQARRCLSTISLDAGIEIMDSNLVVQYSIQCNPKNDIIMELFKNIHNLLFLSKIPVTNIISVILYISR